MDATNPTNFTEIAMPTEASRSQLDGFINMLASTLNSSLNSSQNLSHISTLQTDLAYSEKLIILSWSSLASFFAIVGNVVILLSSLKYNAIHLDRISIVLISHLAGADLAYGIFIATKSVNFALGGDLFGITPCYIITTVSFMFLTAGSTFLSALNISKLNGLLFPLRANIRSFTRGYKIAAFIWSFLVVLQLIIIMNIFYNDEIEIEFNKYTLQCCVNFNGVKPSLLAIGAVIRLLFSIIPMALIFITTIWMMCYVLRVRGNQRQSVFTLLAVSATFFMSLAPDQAYAILIVFLVNGNVQFREGHKIFQIVAQLAIYVRCAANPLIYCVTIRSFGAFVKMKLNFAKTKFVFMLRRRRRVRIANMMARIAARTQRETNL